MYGSSASGIWNTYPSEIPVKVGSSLYSTKVDSSYALWVSNERLEFSLEEVKEFSSIKVTNQQLSPDYSREMNLLIDDLAQGYIKGVITEDSVDVATKNNANKMVEYISYSRSLELSLGYDNVEKFQFKLSLN